MYRPLPAVAFAAFALMSSPRLARSDVRTTFLVEQAKSADVLVRTQALIALGASGDDASVQPLCDALSDSKAPVKIAAAAALVKLGKAKGLPCLQVAEAKEKDFAVKSQIQKSAAALKTAGVPPGLQKPPPPDKDAKFYVAVDVANKTSRPAADIDVVLRGAMQVKLLAQKGYAVAPKGEVSSQGGQIVKSKKLKGFLLTASAEAPIYEGTDLKQTVRLTVWSYPGKVLKGEFAVKLSQSNTKKGDTASEDLLMKMSVESAIDNFLKVADTL